jgi:hypothetical protein
MTAVVRGEYRLGGAAEVSRCGRADVTSQRDGPTPTRMATGQDTSDARGIEKLMDTGTAMLSHDRAEGTTAGGLTC